MSKQKDILALLGDYLRKKAGGKYKSNVEFANVSSVDEKTIRRILAGKQNISVKVLMRVCDSLDLNLSEVFKEIGH